MAPSKGEINRCGDWLRDWWQREPGESYDRDQLGDALDVIWAFRQGFQYPMRKTAVGLRQFVAAETPSVIVAQRLKRLPTIIEKLTRFPETKLARMEDIGGCRAIVPTADDIDRVLGRIRRNWDVKRERDYMTEPKATGYRGFHVVVERDRHRIEIQLRTPTQQGWATTVDTFAGRYRLPLKDDQGPPEILEWLRLAAEGMAAEEAGVPLDVDFQGRFNEARAAAREWTRTHARGATP